MNESTLPDPKRQLEPDAKATSAAKPLVKKVGKAHDPSKPQRIKIIKAEPGRTCRRPPVQSLSHSQSGEASWLNQLDELARQATQKQAVGELDHWLTRCAARLDVRKEAVDALGLQLDAIGSPAQIPSSAWRDKAAKAWEKHALALSCQDSFGAHAGRAWGWAMTNPAMAEAAGIGFGMWARSRGTAAKREVGKLCLELLWPSGMKSKIYPDSVAGIFAEALASRSPQWAAVAAEELLESIALGASPRGSERDLAAARIAMRMMPQRTGPGSGASWAWIMAAIGAISGARNLLALRPKGARKVEPDEGWLLSIERLMARKSFEPHERGWKAFETVAGHVDKQILAASMERFRKESIPSSRRAERLAVLVERICLEGVSGRSGRRKAQPRRL